MLEHLVAGEYSEEGMKEYCRSKETVKPLVQRPRPVPGRKLFNMFSTF